MAYTTVNYKTKKALKEAVKEYLEKHVGEPGSLSYYNVKAYQPGLGPDLSNHTGRVTIEGPHYPAAHTWYAECEMKDGVIIKVK